jgi:tetratricopeptide (TPR) repeat protein
MKCVSGVLVLSTVGFQTVAVASEGDIPPDAKEKYEEGKASFEAGDFDVAIVAFTKAYNLSGEPNLLFNLAACAERLGDAQRAIAYYMVYLEEMPDAEDAASVRERVKQLETEGVPAPDETAPSEPEPEETSAPEKAAVVAPPPDIDPETYYAEKEEKKKTIWPALAIGIGSFVLGSALTMAILANKEYTSLENTCKPDCTDDDIGKAKGLAIASDVQFGIGGAAVVAGVVGLVLTKKREKQASRSVSVRPVGYIGGGQLRIEGRF